MARVIFQTDSFMKSLDLLQNKMSLGARKAVQNVAEDVLRRSQAEVPHDLGTLQNSGHAEHLVDESIVAYGGQAAPYAAKLHEHPEYNFQKGRKGKYLEDPLKNNLPLYREKYGMIIAEVLL